MHDSRWRSLLYCLARATWSIGRSQTPVCTFWWMTRIIDYTHISMALFSANGRSKAAQRIISLNIVNPLFLRIEMKANHDVHYQSQLGAMWICWPPHLSCSIHYERCLICQLLKMRIRRPCTFRKTNVSTDGTPVFACPLPFQTNLIKTVTSRFVCHALFERLTCQGAKCQGSFTFCFFDPNLIRIKPSRFGGRAVSEKNNLSTVEMSIFVYSLLIRNNSDKNENAQKCLPRTFLQKILCQRVKCPDLFTLCFVKTNLLMFFFDQLLESILFVRVAVLGLATICAFAYCLHGFSKKTGEGNMIHSLWFVFWFSFKGAWRAQATFGCRQDASRRIYLFLSKLGFLF